MKKLCILLLFAAISQIGFTQKPFTKLISKVAKLLPTNTQTTSTLNDVVITGGMESNLPPAELGTMAQAFFPGWKTGGDLVSFMFTKKNSAGFYKIDGDFLVDGKPAEYLTIGTYSYISEGNSLPKKIELSTSSGEKASFTVQPSKNNFKVLSINGQKDNVSIDITKDVVIELGGNVPQNALLKITIAINQVSIKSLYDVCYIRSGSTLTIPAAAFRNINLLQENEAVYNYKKSFLSVGIESIENATDVTGSLSSVKYTQLYTDGKLINVTNEPKLNLGIKVKGSEAKMDYELFKPSAFLSRPLSQIKNVGVVSFSIRGTTYKEVSQSSNTTTSKINPFGGVSSSTTVTTITVTKEFPWESLLEKLYPQFVAVIESEFGAKVIPVENVTGCEAYKTLEAFAKDDLSTNVEFTHSFRNMVVRSAFMPFAEGFGVSSINERLMKETGTDALLTMTLDLLSGTGPNNEALIIPKFGFEISGKLNGTMYNTKFFAGSISSNYGAPFTKNVTPQELEAIVRASDLVNAFRKGIQELKQKEKENGDYEQIWNLQN